MTLKEQRFIYVLVLENESDLSNAGVDDNSAMPDWAIAVIVIGLGSLAFVIIFGITVVRKIQRSTWKAISPSFNFLTHFLCSELGKKKKVSPFSPALHFISV